MTANSAGICTNFKYQILTGLHALGTSVVRGTSAADTFKFALYTVNQGIGPSTTVYSSTGELSGTGNYTPGGVAVTNATQPLAYGTTGTWTPSASAVWSNLTSSGSFDTALLYNFSQGGTSGAAIAAFALGTQSITSGTLTLAMPTPGATTSLIQIA